MKNKEKIIVFLLTAIMAICMLSFSAFAKTINCGNTDKVVVKVVWDDENNYDGLRKEESISLKGEHKAIITFVDYEKSERIDIAKNEQTITFDNLETIYPGKLKNYIINYKFTYPDAGDLPGYDVVINNSGNEYTIKYTHKVVKKNITVNSSWIDENNFDGLRKNTSFSLVRKTRSSSEVVETKEIKSSEESQKFSFSDLGTYVNGQLCTYSLEVNTLPSKYRKDIDKVGENEYTITLIHNVQRATIRAIKYWDDDNNKNKVRPEKVFFELFADGQPTGELRTLESRRHVLKDYDTIWSLAEWTNLQMYKDGELINYTVKELDVPDFYKSEMIDNINNIGKYFIDSNVIVIKNTYDSAKRDITVNVVWKDDTVETRPTDYKIQLKANDKDKYAAVSLSTNENTSYKYQDVPANYDGNPIKYSVVQLGVDNNKYTTTITEKDGVFTIVNTLKEPTVEPTDDVNTTVEPTDDVNTTVEPTDDVNTTVEPTDDVNTTVEPTDDVNTTVEPTDDVNTTVKPIVTYPPFTPVNPTSNVSEEPTVMPSEEVTVVPTEENGFNTNEGLEDNVTVQPTKENNLEGLEDDNSDDELDGELKNGITVEKALKAVDNSSEDIDETPKTGDNNNNVGMYVILLFITVCGIVTLYIVRKRV